jgi:hypothetical protein
MTQAARYCNRCGGRLARDNSDSRCAACSHAAPDTLLRPPGHPAGVLGNGPGPRCPRYLAHGPRDVRLPHAPIPRSAFVARDSR